MAALDIGRVGGGGGGSPNNARFAITNNEADQQGVTQLDWATVADCLNNPRTCETSKERVHVDIADAWVYKGVFSEAECKRLIDRLDAEEEEWMTISKAGRECDRRSFISAELGEVMMERLNLIKELPQTLRSITLTKKMTATSTDEIGTEGVWEASRLNPFWRAVRYDEGGLYKRHADGMVALKDEEGHDRSFVTVMAYLSSGFEGGATRFFGRRLSVDEAAEAGSQYEVLAEVHPEPGLVLAFRQSIMHDAQEVIRTGSGDAQPPKKYILRSELLHVKTKDVPPDERWTAEALADLERAKALMVDFDRSQIDLQEWQSGMSALDPEIASVFGF